jgi:peptide/nickel transport system ATP-binding protein
MTELAAEPTQAPVDGREPVLEIKNLEVSFNTHEGQVQAVRGIDLTVYENETLGIVGESGSGKSVTMLAVMGLLPRTATVTGSATYRGEELLGKHGRIFRYRGGRIAMIFQDPLTALNPVHKVGDQISEAVLAHTKGAKKEAARKALDLLDIVGIPQPAMRADQYPHEFSGGMRQRAMIAMAIANDPDFLIADEPTTALDVTVQAQILEVIQKAQEVTKAAVVFITHDLGVIARLATRVQVMYAGRVAEVGSVDDLFYKPRHPYTRGLLDSLPRLEAEGERLQPIAGSPPSMLNPPPGCAFHPRCPRAEAICTQEHPPLHVLGNGHVSACHFAEELGP